jgi:hypothetical protein
VSVLLRLIVLSAGFLDYWSYSQTFYREPGVWMDMVSGTAHAPGQYRIGVIDTAYFLARHTHLGLRHTLALLDVIAGLIAVFTLFLVLRRSPVYRRASQAAEWFGAASFVVLVQFYPAWLLWYQKPETLPTAAMLSLALLLLTVRLNGRLGTMVPVVGLLLLAVAQGFVRADAAFALHVGILLVCLTPAGRGFAPPRRLQAGTSLIAVVLAVGIQYWLMWRMYPQAKLWRYPGAATVSQPEIAGEICSVPSFPGPFAWTAVMLMRRRYQAGLARIAMFTAAVIFLAMWVTVGRIGEVRIFLPFTLTLAPLTVELAMQHFLPEEVTMRG